VDVVSVALLHRIVHLASSGCCFCCIGTIPASSSSPPSCAIKHGQIVVDAKGRTLQGIRRRRSSSISSGSPVGLSFWLGAVNWRSRRRRVVHCIIRRWRPLQLLNELHGLSSCLLWCGKVGVGVRPETCVLLLRAELS